MVSMAVVVQLGQVMLQLVLPVLVETVVEMQMVMVTPRIIKQLVEEVDLEEQE
jgi:hypothetical protein